MSGQLETFFVQLLSAIVLIAGLKNHQNETDREISELRERLQALEGAKHP